MSDASQLEELQSSMEATLRSVIEMVTELRESRDSGDDDRYDAALNTILEDSLEITVRSGWQSPFKDLEPEEYRILLAFGGPSVQITGELIDGVPTTATLQGQGWFAPWTDFNPRLVKDCTSADITDFLLEYAQVFSLG